MTSTVPSFLVLESFQILELLNILRLAESWRPTTAVPPATPLNNETRRLDLKNLLQHHPSGLGVFQVL